ncbi:hypothetical protein AAA67_004818 [Salmonella enterica subsp. diarizonae]|nr:hypothetical protein [Salmonella enterica subsp. diarizonae]
MGYYVFDMTFMQLASNYGCSDSHIGKRLQRAEAFIDGCHMALDIGLEVDRYVQRESVSIKFTVEISNCPDLCGTQTAQNVPQNRTKNRVPKNRDKTSNSAGLSGAKKVRKMRRFRYENCAKRNGQKCAVFQSMKPDVIRFTG